MARAFLSHSSKDKNVADSIVRHLGTASVEIDAETFDRGELNVTAIEQALYRSSIFVLHHSANSAKSAFVQYESSVAQELKAKGIIDKIVIICLDENAFQVIPDDLKKYNIVRRIGSAAGIARLVQHYLILARAREVSASSPFVGRHQELHRAKEQLTDPSRVSVRSLFVSGNSGIGRRTFVRKLYSDVYPHVLRAMPEIRIDRFDGIDELFRKLTELGTPYVSLFKFREMIDDFDSMDDAGKVSRLAKMLSDALEEREAVFVVDAGGLLDDSGKIQTFVKQLHDRIDFGLHPALVFVAERMIPQLHRADLSDTVFVSLPALTRDEARQLIGFLLKREKIKYTAEELDALVELSDLHPFNAEFIVEAVRAYTLQVFIGDTSELVQWKRKRGAEFLQKIDLSDDDRGVLRALRDFQSLDFDTLATIVGDAARASATLSKLLELHVVEASMETYAVSPPLRVAVERDARLVLAGADQKKLLGIIARSLNAFVEGGEAPVSMVDAAVLAMIQGQAEVSEVFSAFLLPSHLIRLARRKYDDRKHGDCLRLATRALSGRGRLSRAGVVEACRLQCLSAARLGKVGEFEESVSILKGLPQDKFTRSNLNFLLGFNARLRGNLPDAEEYFRASYKDGPGNFSTVRELAAICRVRGDLDAAEGFARRAYEIAPDNPYIIDILLNVLLNVTSAKREVYRDEIDYLFERLKLFGEDEGHSFYAARRAEFELKRGNLADACELIDSAVKKTPGLFSLHALRATIYLEQGNKAVVSDELKRMQQIIDDADSGEGKSGVRQLLELKAAFLVASKDYAGAKRLLSTKGVFTEDEVLRAIRAIDFHGARSGR